MGGWRDALKAEGIPREPMLNIPTILTIHETRLAKLNSGDCGNSGNRRDTLTLPVEALRPAPGMAPDVAMQLAADSEAMFIHFSRKLYDRLSLVMRPGYLAWTQTHEPELWAGREASRMLWDDSAAYQAFKDCRTPWPEYRRRVHQWAMVELAAIRRHRQHLGRINRPRLPDGLAPSPG